MKPWDKQEALQRMNKKRLQKLVDSYTEKFSSLHDSEHGEMLKWTAVSRFQKYWDPDAGDFGQMFQAAFEDADPLIDTAVSQPINGIIYLCGVSGEVAEAVRTEFKKLFAPDNSDYAAREKKAEDFIVAVNLLLKQNSSDMWKYHQDISSALLYLSCFDPDDNYMYSDEEARAVAYYLGVKSRIFTETTVNMTEYYNMCDEILSAIRGSEELQQDLAEALDREAQAAEDSSILESDTEYHILVYDLIVCAQNYEMIDESQTLPKKKKLSAKDLEKQQDEERLAHELEETEASLADVVAARGALSWPEFTGVVVTHRVYGEGRIVEQTETRLTVAFGDTQKKFVLPKAFTGGFLTAEPDDGLCDQCRRIEELDRKIRELQNAVNVIKVRQNGWKA